MNVLLIEDNLGDVRLIAEAYHEISNDVTILHKRKGEHALQFLESNPLFPQIILLDLNLPGEDGLNILTKIKEIIVDETVHIAILTSSNDEKDRLRSYQLGATDYAVKPPAFHQLVTVLQEITNAFLEKREVRGIDHG